MLVTARDIVLRLPDADEARVRVELAGNLCRCTGYQGIVARHRRVLAERRAGTLAAAEPRINAASARWAHATTPGPYLSPLAGRGRSTPERSETGSG